MPKSGLNQPEVNQVEDLFFIYIVLLFLVVFVGWLVYCEIIDSRSHARQWAEIDEIKLEILALHRFISEMASPSPITPQWTFTEGKDPALDSNIAIRVIMKDGQDIEAFPPYIFWQNSICYRVLSV